MLDLLVIGGGVHGAAIARDAALRGLSVTLVERRDLASGTSSRSSKLAHGGLRYLERLHVGLVRESLRERDILRRVAPHLTWDLPFIVPFSGPAPRRPWMVRAGLLLYDFLAGDTDLPRHRVIGEAEAVAHAPALASTGLRSAALYHDAGMDDARIVVELALDAALHGATILTHHEAQELVARAGRVQGARVRTPGGDVSEILARVTVVACGPWTDAVAGRSSTGSQRLVLTKGVHVFTRRQLAADAAVMLASPVDGRVVFLIPWRGGTLVGTTDTRHRTGPDAVQADADDVAYLLDSVNALLPSAQLTLHDVVAVQAGLRPLVAPARPGAPSSVSRDYHLDTAEPGLVVVEGGKYTIFRRLAERVVDHAAAEVRAADGARTLTACPTRTQLFPGGHAEFAAFALSEAEALAREGVPAASARRLVGRYGARARAVVAAAAGDAALLEPACPHHPHLAVEALVAVRDEFARTAADALLRRLDLGWWDCPGLPCAPRFAAALRQGGLDASAAPEDLAEVQQDIAENWRFPARHSG